MARSGEDILDSFFKRGIDTGLLTARFDQGRIGLFFSTLSAELNAFEEIMDFYQMQNNLMTASTEQSIENLAAPLARRRVATPSQVILTFERVEGINGDIKIPMGTIVEVAQENPIQFRTDIGVHIYEGQDFVKVAATSIDFGAKTMVGPGALTIVSNWTGDYTVINEESSFGGLDKESIEETRERALNFRYLMEKGTRVDVDKIIRSTGIRPEDYNVIEYAFGYGTFAVYVDTQTPELLNLIYKELKESVLYGIYLKCIKATLVDLDCEVNVKIAKDRDLTPAERSQLIALIRSLFADYVRLNGIGNKLRVSKATHYLYQELLFSYDIADITLDITGPGILKDDKGNVALENHERLVLNNFTARVEVG